MFIYTCIRMYISMYLARSATVRCAFTSSKVHTTEDGCLDHVYLLAYVWQLLVSQCELRHSRASTAVHMKGKRNSMLSLGAGFSITLLCHLTIKPQRDGQSPVLPARVPY